MRVYINSMRIVLMKGFENESEIGAYCPVFKWGMGDG
jgi:hypothetical protein